ncbi:unnamed protein product, partial [Staurois parvus]
HFGLCVLPGSAQHGDPWNTVIVRDLCVRPISDHMQISKQDVTSDIIAYYV